VNRKARRQKRILRRVLATAAAGTGVALAPAGVAHADVPTPPAAAPYTLTFVPPKVNKISVLIGPVIIGGKVISPGVYVESPGTELPTLTVTLPRW
jgi:hypothetical protein